MRFGVSEKPFYRQICLSCKRCVFSSSDKPATPVLSASTPNPTYGDSITLTCASSTEGITNYKFFKGTSMLTATSNGNTYTINNATEVKTGGVQYSCQAFMDSVPSDRSAELKLKGMCNYSFQMI